MTRKNRALRVGLACFFILITSLVTMGVVGAQVQEYPSTAFTDPEVCGGCHVDIYEQWSATILSKAYTDPFYRAEMQEAVHDTDGALSTFCVKCHSPIGVFAGQHIPVDGSNMSEIAIKGVQCDFCHTISGLDGISNGNFINTPGKVKRGPFDDAVSPFHETEYSLLHTRAEVCGICHDIYHPTNGLRLEATYFEWREGPYGKQGIVCQDCHMTPGPGVTKPNPGKAAIQGPEREHIYTHYFVGGNVLYGNRELAIERLQAAGQIAFNEPEPFRPGEERDLDVIVRNVGAGHYLPTSLTYVRQMWLDVEVTDAGGRVVGEKQVMYNTVLENAEGVHDGSVPPWRAVSIYRDYRIPPGDQVVEQVPLEIPEDVQGPLDVTAVLNYRSASPEQTAKFGLPEFPIIEMTRATLQIPIESGGAEALLRALDDYLWWIATAIVLVLALILTFARRAA